MITTLAFLLKNRRFRFYFFGTIVSTVGDGMQSIGMAWLLTQLTGTTSAIGWMLALTSVPGILFSPWIGVLVDRWDRRLTCMGADLFRGVAVAIIPILYIFHSLEIWMLYTIVLIVSFGDRFFLPASGGLVREIVSSEDLISANSLSSMVLQMGVLVGAGLGGIIIASYNPVYVMALNALSFFLSALFGYFIRKGTYVPLQAGRKGASVYRDFREGVSYLKQHRHLIQIGVLQLFLYITIYTANVLLPSFSLNILHVGSTGFGLIDASWAVGAILGGIFLLSMIKKVGMERYVTSSMFLLVASILIFLTSEKLIQATIGYTLMGLFFVSTRITYDTMLQSRVPTNFQGRVKSTISMVISYFSFLVYLCVGYLGDIVSLRSIYGIIACIIFIGGVLSFRLTRTQQELNAPSSPVVPPLQEPSIYNIAGNKSQTTRPRKTVLVPLDNRASF